jgi:hypothetical protein
MYKAFIELFLHIALPQGNKVSWFFERKTLCLLIYYAGHSATEAFPIANQIFSSSFRHTKAGMKPVSETEVSMETPRTPAVAWPQVKQGTLCSPVHPVFEELCLTSSFVIAHIGQRNFCNHSARGNQSAG